jgi:hypothetical protein
MTLDYAILALVLGALYAILKNYVPDFPLDESTLLVIIVYVLGKLGVSIVKNGVVAYQARKAAEKAEALKATKKTTVKKG